MQTSTLVVLVVVIVLNLSKHGEAQPIEVLPDSLLYSGVIVGADNGVEVKVPGEIADRQAPVSGRPLYERRNRCEMPIKKGVCRALIPRWSYNPETKECEEFKFGGCDGNANNFSTYEQCMRTCAAE